MDTVMRVLLRSVTYLFVIGGIGSAFVLVLTFIDDVKLLFEKRHTPSTISPPELHSGTAVPAHTRT